MVLGRASKLDRADNTSIALWLALSFTVLTTVPAWWVKLLLLSVGIGVTTHLLWISTLKPETGTQMRTISRSPEEPEHRPQSSYSS